MTPVAVSQASVVHALLSSMFTGVFAQPVIGSQVSTAVQAIAIETISWFGGQSRAGSADSVSAGGSRLAVAANNGVTVIDLPRRGTPRVVAVNTDGEPATWR